MPETFRAEDLPVGWRAQRYHVTLTKTAVNIWQGNAPCAPDGQINDWLTEGAALLPPLDPDQLRGRLAEIAEDSGWSPVLRIHAKYAAYGHAESRVWPASLADHDIRDALRRAVDGCRPGPLRAPMPDTPEKLRAWVERNTARRSPSG